MIGREVPAGTSRPYHVVYSKPGMPASAIVGTSGSVSARFALVTPKLRSFPDLTWGSADANVDRKTEISFPRTAVSAGPVPLYGTWISWTLFVRQMSSIARCVPDPVPAEPYVSL